MAWLVPSICRETKRAGSNGVAYQVEAPVSKKSMILEGLGNWTEPDIWSVPSTSWLFLSLAAVFKSSSCHLWQSLCCSERTIFPVTQAVPLGAFQQVAVGSSLEVAEQFLSTLTFRSNVAVILPGLPLSLWSSSASGSSASLHIGRQFDSRSLHIWILAELLSSTGLCILDSLAHRALENSWVEGWSVQLTDLATISFLNLVEVVRRSGRFGSVAIEEPSDCILGMAFHHVHSNLFVQWSRGRLAQILWQAHGYDSCSSLMSSTVWCLKSVGEIAKPFWTWWRHVKKSFTKILVNIDDSDVDMSERGKHIMIIMVDFAKNLWRISETYPYLIIWHAFGTTHVCHHVVRETSGTSSLEGLQSSQAMSGFVRHSLATKDSADKTNNPSIPFGAPWISVS